MMTKPAVSDVARLTAQLCGDKLSDAIQAAEALGCSRDPRARIVLESRFAPYRSMRVNPDEYNVFFFTLALVLAEMGSFRAFRLVVDEDAPFVRTRVVSMLERVGEARAIKAAIQMLNSREVGERYWAAQILRALRARSASSALIRAQARENHMDVRLAMIGALAYAGDVDAIPVLEAMQNDPRWTLRRAAAAVLRQLRAAV